MYVDACASGYISIVFIGFAGTACLLSLGKWQIDRLHWKTDLLEKIDQKITEVPVILPAKPNEDDHKYLSVEILGQYTGESIPVGGLAYYLSPPMSFYQLLVDPFRTVIFFVLNLALCGWLATKWLDCDTPHRLLS